VTSHERVNLRRSLTQHNRLIMLGDCPMARKRSNRLEVSHPDCAGIDIGKSKHYVAVGPTLLRRPGAPFWRLWPMSSRPWRSGCASVAFAWSRWNRRARL